MADKQVHSDGLATTKKTSQSSDYSIWKRFLNLSHHTKVSKIKVEWGRM
jgi:hypothetical protein